MELMPESFSISSRKLASKALAALSAAASLGSGFSAAAVPVPGVALWDKGRAARGGICIRALRGR